MVSVSPRREVLLIHHKTKNLTGCHHTANAQVLNLLLVPLLRDHVVSLRAFVAIILFSFLRVLSERRWNTLFINVADTDLIRKFDTRDMESLMYLCSVQTCVGCAHIPSLTAAK